MQYRLGVHRSTVVLTIIFAATVVFIVDGGVLKNSWDATKSILQKPFSTIFSDPFTKNPLIPKDDQDSKNESVLSVNKTDDNVYGDGHGTKIKPSTVNNTAPNAPVINATESFTPKTKLETTTHERTVINAPLKQCPEGQRRNPDRQCEDFADDPDA